MVDTRAEDAWEGSSMIFFRGMREADDGYPAVDGNPAKALAVRVGSGEADDIDANDAGEVHPNTGGLSVSLTIQNLPPYRLPVALGGSANHPLFQIDSAVIPENLQYREDPIPEDPTHHCIEPAEICLLAEYVRALAGTRALWTKY
jgi:hypothetical protein